MTIKNTLTAATLAGLGLLGAANLVDRWEGNTTSRYVDPLGIATICRGHTGFLTRYAKVTEAQCDAALIEDLKVAAATVARCVDWDSLSAGEKAAWTSFALNVGPGGRGVKDGMCRLKTGAEPSHVRLLRQGRHREACAMLDQWTMPGTNVHRGLKARRADEKAACLKDL